MHTKQTLLLASLSLIPALAHAQNIPDYVTQAVASPARPAADRADDAARKPAETLAFIGVKPGDKVVDMLPGQGYFTQLFCGIVGPTGHVYQFEPTGLKFPKPPAGAPPRTPPPAPICTNASKLAESLAAITTPEPVDVILTSRNYHDFHNPMFGKPDMAALDRGIYNALKPGGVFIVLDHADSPGTGASDTATLHRIDPALVKQEVTAVGFQFAGESTALQNPADNHTLASHDPAIRGHTDQFIFKFRKPAS